MIWQRDFKQLEQLAESAEFVKKNKKIEYLNLPISFDIETSSFYQHKQKKACMYVWAVCVNGLYFTGRTWEEFLRFIDKLKECFEISDKRRLVIYVHNLAYEFQFIKHYFEFQSVMAIKLREPIKALTTDGIEFRCSYLLSGYNLATLADVYLKNQVKKLNGFLDYSLIRHTSTPLDRKEYNYLYNDVRIVYQYIQMKIKQDGNIIKICNTKTGYVRKLLERNCIGSDVPRHMRLPTEQRNYRNLMKRLTISGVEEYKLMKRAYTGGHTHASILNKGIVFLSENGKAVTSYDFTSSYPTCLIAYGYPISSGRKVHPKNMQELEKYCEAYCCIFDVRFTNLRSKISYENYLSFHKCKCEGNVQTDNGKIVAADICATSITNVDFDIIKECYEWDKIEIGLFYIYIRGYLPTPFIKTILELYEKKTMLKGVSGREAEYQAAKENINALYGACVTDLMHDEFKVEHGEWKSETPDMQATIDRYNKQFNRVLYYPWGIFCT